jgi:hypothetical protein
MVKICRRGLALRCGQPPVALGVLGRARHAPTQPFMDRRTRVESVGEPLRTAGEILECRGRIRNGFRKTFHDHCVPGRASAMPNHSIGCFFSTATTRPMLDAYPKSINLDRAKPAGAIDMRSPSR